MSHITKRKSSMKNLDCIKKACKRSGAEFLGSERARRTGGANGVAVKLPGWRNPVTINMDTGECTYDNYGGRWGKNDVLDQFKQGYAVEAAKGQAALEGREFEEETLPNGDIKCVIPLGGGGMEVEGGGGGSDWDV